MKKILSRLLPILTVFIWFQMEDSKGHKFTEVDVWAQCDSVATEPNLVNGTLSITPLKRVFGWPVSHEERQTTYFDVSFTVLSDNGESAVYLAHLQRVYKNFAPVEDVKLMPDADKIP